MSIHKSYAVFGLGRYGRAVATELAMSGAEVMAVDVDEKITEEVIADIPVCKCADVTDKEVISRLGISNFDTVIIAMAMRFEVSVMATMLCKEAGVETVIVKCANEVHKKILERVGADRVVLPEVESGQRLARNLLCDGFIDVVDLSDNISIVEMDVKKEWTGKNLIELDLRKKYGINIIAIKDNENISITFSPETKLSDGMKLVVIAENKTLNKVRHTRVEPRMP